MRLQKHLILYDVYENQEVAQWSESTIWIGDQNKVQSGLCSVADVKCTTYDEFAARIQPYTNQ